MKRYLVLPLALLISSPAYSMEKSPSSMKKMEPKNWVQQRDGTFIAMGEFTEVYQKPIDTKKNNDEQVTFYTELYRNCPDSIMNLKKAETALIISLVQKESLDHLKSSYFQTIQNINKINQNKKDSKSNSEITKLAQELINAENLKNKLLSEFSRRRNQIKGHIFGNTPNMTRLENQIEAKQNIVNKIENRLQSQKEALSSLRSQIEASSSRASQGNLAPEKQKSNILKGTLILAEDYISDLAEQAALVEQFKTVPSERSYELAQALIQQDEKTSDQKKLLQERMTARETFISELEKQYARNNSEAVEMYKELYNLKKQQNENLKLLASLDNWLAHPTKIETPKKGWLSYLGF